MKRNTIAGVDVKRSPTTAWAFTYKVLGEAGTNDMGTYADVISNLSSNGFIKHVKGELDSKGKYHIHGIVLLRKGFHRKLLVMRGFNCKLVEVYDEKEWLRYCDKDQEVLPKTVPYLFDPHYLT